MPDEQQHPSSGPEPNASDGRDADALRMPRPSPADALRDALLKVSPEELSRLTADDLSRLCERSEQALRERRMRDRKTIFREMSGRLLKTDLPRTLREGGEAERREALRDAKECLCALGFRVSVEALDRLSRPEKKAPPRGTA